LGASPHNFLAVGAFDPIAPMESAPYGMIRFSLGLGVLCFTAIRYKTSGYSMALEPARQPGHVAFAPYRVDDTDTFFSEILVYSETTSAG